MKLAVLAIAASLATVSATTYQRLGTCPTLGCVLPPDQSDFLPGQLFDLRVEVHAPVNGSQAAHDGEPDPDFSLTIARDGGQPRDVADFFAVARPELERWQFKWYEDLFAEDSKTPSVVNVASRAYRKLALSEPGKYTVTLQYYRDQKTTAEWIVRPRAETRRAKNVIFFIGDGMTTNMVRCASPDRHRSGCSRASRSPPRVSSGTRASTANTRRACRWTTFPPSATR